MQENDKKFNFSVNSVGNLAFGEGNEGTIFFPAQTAQSTPVARRSTNPLRQAWNFTKGVAGAVREVTPAVIESTGYDITNTVFTALRALTEPIEESSIRKVTNQVLVDKGYDPRPTEVGPVLRLRNDLLGPANREAVEKIKLLEFAQQDLYKGVFDEEEGLNSMKEYAFVAEKGSASLLTAIGVGLLTRNTSVAAGFLASMEASDDYNQAKNAGLSSEEALRVAGRSGVGTFLLEKMGIDYLFGVSGSSRLISGVKGSLFETTQELAQTAFQNLNRKFSYDQEQQIWQGWYETIVATALPSFIAGLVLPGVPVNVRRDVIQDMSEKADLSTEDAARLYTETEKAIQSLKSAFQRNVLDSIPERGVGNLGLSTEDISGEQQEPEAIQNLINKQAEDIRKQVEESEFMVLTELELAQAGERIFSFPDKQGSTPDVIAVPSSFPKWIPSELRTRKLVDQAIEVYEGRETTRSKKVERLVSLIEQRVLDNLPQHFQEIEILNRMDQSFAKAERQARDERITKMLTQLKDQRTTVEGKKIQKLPAFTQNIGSKGRINNPFMRKREFTLLKDRLKNISRGMKLGQRMTKAEIAQSQTQLINLIEQANIPTSLRGRFLRTVKNTQTSEQFAKNLPVIIERLERLETHTETRAIKKRILNKIKKTKIKNINGKPVGKFTPEIQAVFEKLRGYSKMRKSELETILEDKMANLSDKIPTTEVALENEFLNLLVNIDNMTVEEIQSLEETINALFDEGRMINELEKFNRISEYEALKATVIDRVTGGKGLDPSLETTGIQRKGTKDKLRQTLKGLGQTFIMNWDSVTGTLEWGTPVGQEVLPERLSVHTQENKFKELQAEGIQEINAMFSEAYNIPPQKHMRIGKKIADNTREVTVGTFKNTEGIPSIIKMTKDEMIKRYMEFQDPTLNESFIEGNKYTTEIQNAILSKLSRQDKRLGDLMLDFYQRKYPQINNVYRDIYGVDLPSNEFYSPIQREGVNLGENNVFGQINEDSSYRRSVNPSAVKSRTGTLKPLKKMGATESLTRHLDESNYFIAWATKVREFNHIFSDPSVRTTIKDNFGGKFLSTIDQNVTQFTQNGNKYADTNRTVDKLRKGFTVGALAVKPAIAVKQMVSTFAYLEKLNPVNFTVGVVDFWSNPIRNARILNEESVFIRERGSNMERDIKAATNSDTFTAFKKAPSFFNTLLLNVRLGDKGAILTGAWAMRKVALKRGATIEEAVLEYERFSNETQQSSDLSQLSLFQRGGSFAKLFTMFMSSQRQYLNKELNAVRSIFRKGGRSKANIQKVAKILFIYHIMLPVLFQFVANFGRLDEEALKDYMRAGILGSINGLFLFGSVIDSVLRASLGLKVWDTSIPIIDTLDEIKDAITSISIEDISNGDIYDMLGAFSEAASVFGIPSEQAVDMVDGFSDLLEGDIREGIGQILGWSEYSMGANRKSGSGGIELPSVEIPTIEIPTIEVPEISI